MRSTPFKRWLAEYSKEFKTFLIVHSLFLIFTRLPGVFINTMMMEPGAGIKAVLSYNFSFFITGAMCMYIAAFVLKRCEARITAIIGIVAYFAMYLLIIVLGDKTPQYHYLVGIFNGLADGFYWISYGQLLTGTLRPVNRDRGLAVINVLGSLISLIVPLIAGIIISKIGGLGGYITIMAIASLIAAGACMYALKLPHDDSKAGQKRTDFKAALLMVRNEETIRNALLGQWAKGIREGASQFLLSAVLYQVIRSELLIGINSFFSSLAGILAFVYLSRAVTQENRIKLMFYSVIALCCMGLFGIIVISPWMIMVYGAVNAMFSGSIANGGYSIFLEALTENEQTKNIYPETLALNESFLVLGRCIGLAVIWLVIVIFGDSPFWNLVSLLILSLSQFLTVYFSGKANRLLKHR